MSRQPMTVEGAIEAIRPVTIERRIACVRRELRLREVNYPRWVQSGRMKQEEADDEIQAMRAVLGTLELAAATVPVFEALAGDMGRAAQTALAQLGHPDVLPVLSVPAS